MVDIHGWFGGGESVCELCGEHLGGFQSGFSAQKVPREEAKYPDYLICSHGCKEVIQLVSHVSGEVEFELCAIEALRMAQVLIAAVHGDTEPGDTHD